LLATSYLHLGMVTYQEPDKPAASTRPRMFLFGPSPAGGRCLEAQGAQPCSDDNYAVARRRLAGVWGEWESGRQRSRQSCPDAVELANPLSS
jgi:hypothetical protein